jgi:predicted ArsR family transcriptional regulator
MTSTSLHALAVATKSFGSRREQILALLREHGPLALFEIASMMGLGDHQLSGRLGAMGDEGLIRRTGKQRLKPSTGCPCDLWEFVTDAERCPRPAKRRREPQRHKQGELFSSRKSWPD